MKSNKQLEALQQLKEDAKKLKDRELLEEIHSKQLDIQISLGGIRSSTHWSFIMIGCALFIMVIAFPPLWLR